MTEENKKDKGAAVNAKGAEQKYSKEQIVSSEKYRGQRDLVDALLEGGKMYELKTVDSMIERFMKGKVK